MQVILARLAESQSTPSSTDYWVPMGQMRPTSSSSHRAIWPCAGAFSELVVTIGTAPGSGKSRTFTLMKNNTATALAVTISDDETTARTSGTTVDFAEGDEISLRSVPTNSPATVTAGQAWVSMTFAPTVAAQSGYASQSSVYSHAAGTERANGVFAGASWVALTSIDSLARNLVGCGGTLDRLYAYQTVANGAGVTTTYTVFKNGVAQDGTGGTPDTRIAIGPGVATGSASFSLALTPGDLVYTHVTNTGGSLIGFVSVSARFTADVAGESQWVGCSGTAMTTSDNYWVGSGYDSVRTDTETNAGLLGGVTAFRVAGLRVILTTAPGGATSRTFSLRKNGAAIPATPSVTIAGTDTDGIDTSGNSATVSDGDVDWVLHSSTSGSPAGANFQWAGIATLVPPQIIGALVAGVNTTVKASRAIAFGLDGETNVHDREGTFAVWGDVQFLTLPTSDPSVAGVLWNDSGTLKISAG